MLLRDPVPLERLGRHAVRVRRVICHSASPRLHLSFLTGRLFQRSQRAGMTCLSSPGPGRDERVLPDRTRRLTQQIRCQRLGRPPQWAFPEQAAAVQCHQACATMPSLIELKDSRAKAPGSSLPADACRGMSARTATCHGSAGWWRRSHDACPGHVRPSPRLAQGVAGERTAGKRRSGLGR